MDTITPNEWNQNTTFWFGDAVSYLFEDDKYADQCEFETWNTVFG